LIFAILKQNNLKFFTTKQYRGELLPLHVSVDIDSLDPWYAPCTGTPVLGGLTLPEIMYIGNKIHETGKLRTLDLVEVNPLLKSCENDVEKTIFSACRTILSFFGYKTLGTKNPEHEVPKPDQN
jgi:arginase